ncbi:MAG: serine/threonine protein kinase [Planctomycetia bacterium]|nr:serine/threonine protein kinase [Planctomycetia bacterium]
MTNSGSDQTGSDSRLDAVLAEYMQAVEAGTVPDRQEFVARHPEFASQLEEFFGDKERFDRVVAPYKPAVGQQPLPANDDTEGKSHAALLETPTLIVGTSAPPPQPGIRVRYFGDYELLEEIARGGMGVVYKARQANLKRIVALKMILVGQLANDEEIKRFYAEAQAAARLEHAHIVPIFEIGQHEQQHYFTMAFIDGESLAHRVSREVLPPREAAAIILKVVRAISYAHVEGVVHRDLKPANILMDRAGEPHITDFGLAKRVGTGEVDDESPAQLTVTGQVLGTPSYMPPEQAAGRTAEIGPLADVYSLGALLYCLLAGRPPFQAASPVDTLLQVLEKEPVSPRALNAAVPRDLETICLKCLEKEPHRRYDSAKALADDLQRYLDGEAIVARPLGLVEKALRLARKHRKTLIRTAATAATSLLIATGAWFGRHAYYEMQLGRISLKTDGYPLTAEVRNDHGELVVPAFTVPTEQLVPLPAGEYRVQFSAPGEWSQTQLLTVDRGWSPEYTVDLRDRQLWKPIQIGPADFADVIRLADQDAVIVLERRFGRTMLRRLEGRTTNVVWERPLADQLIELERNFNAANPPELLKPLARATWDANIQLEPPNKRALPPDLNADGTGDLVWVLRDATSVLAVSGADGSLLWRFRSEVGNGRRVLGQPLVTDVDGDARPDLIATFQSPQRTWIEAIRGSDGTSLWQYDVDRGAANSNGTDHVPTTALVTLDGRAHVSVDLGTRMLLVSASTGTPLEGAFEWPLLLSEQVHHTDGQFLLLHATQWIDLNADGNTDALLFHDSRGDAVLTAMDLKSKGVLWTQNVSRRIELTADAAHAHHFRKAAQFANWPLVVDLELDGRPEIVMPGVVDSPRATVANNDSRFGIHVFDGTSGKRRWSRVLYQAGGQTPVFRQLLVAPDVSDDGHRELVVISTGPSQSGEWNRMDLFVDGLSGRDGERLARWRHDNVGGFMPSVLAGRFDGATWWARSSRGWPDLLVSIARSRYGNPDEKRLAVVSLEQQRETEKLLDVDVAYPADFDGDGLIDLWYRRHTVEGDRVQALGGTPRELWRRTGGAVPIHDCDGDGVADLLETRPPGALIDAWTRIYSGRDGSIVRRIRTQTSFNNQVLAGPHGDLDGRGIPDILARYFQNRFHDTAPRLDKTMEIPFRAVSTETGDILWDTPMFAVPEPIIQQVKAAKSLLFAYDTFGTAVDLDGDQRPEVLCCFQLQWGNDDRSAQYWLALVKGATGSVIWAAPLTEGALKTEPLDRHAQPRHVANQTDVNGDGRSDLILVVPRLDDAQTCTAEIQARSGSDGALLWTYALPTQIGRNDAARFLDLVPLPVVGDLDGDGKSEIVLIERQATENDSAAPRYAVILLAADVGKARVLHTWEGVDAQLPTPVPLLADLADNDGSSVVLVGQYDALRTGLTVIGADGAVRWHSPAAVADNVMGLSPVADLDGDGRDELIAWNNGALRAIDGVQQELWTWTSPDGPSIAPGGIQLCSADGGQRSLVVQFGSQFFELAAGTGRLLRRASGLPREIGNRPYSANHFWLPAKSPETLPIVISHRHSLVALEVLTLP